MNAPSIRPHLHPHLWLHQLAIRSALANRTPRSWIQPVALPEWDHFTALLGK